MHRAHVLRCTRCQERAGFRESDRGPHFFHYPHRAPDCPERSDWETALDAIGAAGPDGERFLELLSYLGLKPPEWPRARDRVQVERTVAAVLASAAQRWWTTPSHRLLRALLTVEYIGILRQMIITTIAEITRGHGQPDAESIAAAIEAGVRQLRLPEPHASWVASPDNVQNADGIVELDSDGHWFLHEGRPVRTLFVESPSYVVFSGALADEPLCVYRPARGGLCRLRDEQEKVTDSLIVHGRVITEKWSAPKLYVLAGGDAM